jgi:hypothetical protein
MNRLPTVIVLGGYVSAICDQFVYDSVIAEFGCVAKRRFGDKRVDRDFRSM